MVLEDSSRYCYSERDEGKVMFSTSEGYRKVQIESIGENEKVYMGSFPRSYIEFTDPLLLGFIKDKIKGVEQKFLDPTVWYEHTSIFGGRGTGKSTLLLNQMVSLAYSGHGFSFIDPGSWGDTAQKLIQKLPKNRLDDVVIIQPGSSRDKTVEINLLDPGECDTKKEFEREAEAIKNDLKAILKDESYWGPLMDGVFKNIFRAMMYSSKNYNIIDMYKILNNDRLRERFAEKTKEDVDKYIQEYTQTIKRKEREDLDSLIRRIQDWYENPIVRKIVGNRKNTIDIKQLIENQKILIVNPRIDDIHAKRMVPTWIIRRIWNVIRSRKDIKEIDRTPHFLFIDEFHSIYNEEMNLQNMLAEARKGKLGIFLATQNPSQLPEKIRKQIIAETQTIVSFAVRSPEDAETISQRLTEIDKTKITNMDRYKALLATTVEKNGKKTYDTFYINTYPPYPPLRTKAETQKIIQKSLKRYGTKKTTDTIDTKLVIEGYKKTQKQKLEKELRNDLLTIAWSLSIKNHRQKTPKKECLEELKKIRDKTPDIDIPKPKKYLKIEKNQDITYYNITEIGKKPAIKRKGEPYPVPERHVDCIRKLFVWLSKLGITPKVQTRKTGNNTRVSIKGFLPVDPSSMNIQRALDKKKEIEKTKKIWRYTDGMNLTHTILDKNPHPQQILEELKKSKQKGHKTTYILPQKHNQYRTHNKTYNQPTKTEKIQNNNTEDNTKKQYTENKTKNTDTKKDIEEKNLDIQKEKLDIQNKEKIEDAKKEDSRNIEKLENKEPLSDTETSLDISSGREDIKESIEKIEQVLFGAMSGKIYNKKDPINIDRYQYVVVRGTPRWKLKEDPQNRKLITLYSTTSDADKIDSGRPKGWLHLDDLGKNKIPYNQFYNKVKKQDGEYIVETQNTKHKYKTKKELLKNWNIVKEPFVPKKEYTSKIKTTDWNIILIPNLQGDPLVYNSKQGIFESILSSSDPRSKKLHDNLLQTTCDKLIKQNIDIQYRGGPNEPDAIAIDKDNNKYHLEAENTGLTKPASQINSYLTAKQKNRTPIYIVQKAPENKKANAEKLQNILQKSNKGKIYTHPNKSLKIQTSNPNTKNKNAHKNTKNKDTWIALRHKTSTKKHTWKTQKQKPKHKNTDPNDTNTEPNQDPSPDRDIDEDLEQNTNKVSVDQRQNSKDLEKDRDIGDSWFVLETKDRVVGWIDDVEDPTSYYFPVVAKKKQGVYLVEIYEDKNGNRYSHPKTEIYTESELKDLYSWVKKPVEAKEKISDGYGIAVVDLDTDNIKTYKEDKNNLLSKFPKTKNQKETTGRDKKDTEEINNEIIKEITTHHLKGIKTIDKQKDIEQKDLPDQYVISKKVYNLYKQKAKNRDIDQDDQLNHVWFSRKLGNHIRFETTEKNIDNQVKRVLKGIKLKK